MRTGHSWGAAGCRQSSHDCFRSHWSDCWTTLGMIGRGRQVREGILVGIHDRLAAWSRGLCAATASLPCDAARHCQLGTQCAD